MYLYRSRYRDVLGEKKKINISSINFCMFNFPHLEINFKSFSCFLKAYGPDRYKIWTGSWSCLKNLKIGIEVSHWDSIWPHFQSYFIEFLNDIQIWAYWCFWKYLWIVEHRLGNILHPLIKSVYFYSPNWYVWEQYLNERTFEYIPWAMQKLHAHLHLAVLV